MKVTLERLPESRVQLAIEVEQDRVDQSLEAAYKRLASRAKVPGFRPGKAPRALIERYLGQDRLMNEALDRLVPAVYNEAIETEDVDAIAQPELETLELDPVRLKFVVPVRPKVDLGDYRSIRVEKETTEVTDEMIAEQLLGLRRRFAIHAPVERPVQWGDILTADVKGTVDGDQFVEDENAEFALREGATLLVPGLAEAFLGMSRGDEKTVELTILEDFRVERLQGKTASFELKLHEVKEEQLPDEDDDLAAQINADEFPDLESLRKRIREDLETSFEREATAKLTSAAIEKLLEGATIDYPTVLVDREVEHLINETTRNDRSAYERYLQSIGRSEQEYKESLRPDADLRVRRSLVVNEFAEREGIEVTEADIEAELDKLTAPLGDDAQRFREMFTSGEGLATIRRNLLSEKTLERLAAVVAGEAPEQPAQESAAAAEEPAQEGQEKNE